MVWLPLLACPAVQAKITLVDKPAVAPTSKAVITFENSYKKVYVNQNFNHSATRRVFDGEISFFDCFDLREFDGP